MGFSDSSHARLDAELDDAPGGMRLALVALVLALAAMSAGLLISGF